MARSRLIASVILLAITTKTESQFFDFYPSFQGFQPFQPSTLTPIQKGQPYEIHLTNGNRNNNNNNHRNIKKTTTTTESSVFNAAINKDIPFSAFLNVPENNNQRFFVNNNDNSYTTTTTSKPARRNNSSQKNTNNNRNPSNDRNVNSNNYDTNTNDNNRNVNNYSNDRNTNNNHNDNRNVNNNNYDRSTSSSFDSNTNNNDRNTFYNDRNVNNNNNYDRNTNNNDKNSNNNNYDRNTNTNNNKNTNNKRKQNEQTTHNQFSYDKPIIFDNNKNNFYNDIYYTTGPLYNEITTKQPTYNQQTRKTTARPEYTTSSPFYNSPGVKPPVYHNGPPITNKPIRGTERPEDGLVFPEDQVKLVTGPDEDDMSEVQKRRYDELVERMCDKFKTLSQKQVQAIPLLPSPDAVRVNVSCAANPTPLIVGGQTVTIAQYPHSAAVGWRNEQGRGYSWKCGGSLISDQYVLTAAHCTFQDRDNSIASGPPQAVQLGSSQLNGRNARIHKISVAIRHPKYKRPIAYYDIALLKLAGKVSFSETIRPACIGPPPPPGTKLTATGWGRTEFNGDQSNELRGVSLPIWDMSSCSRVLGVSRRLPHGPSSESQLCAGDYSGGKDTCQGDSGGPIQYRDGCAWRVAGATSLGVACGAPRTPAVYALPAKYFVAAVAFS